MTETFISTVRELCNYLPYLYILMFVLSLGLYKQLTSLSLTIILVACAEIFMDAIASPLLTALNDKSVDAIIRLGIWLMFWCYFYALCVYALEKSHIWLNISKGRTLVIIESVFGVLILFELLYFANAFFIQSNAVKAVYHAGLPFAGLSMGVYLFSELLLSIKDHYVSRSNTASDAA